MMAVEQVVKPQFYTFMLLRRFQHCAGHTMTGSWKGTGK